MKTKIQNDHLSIVINHSGAEVSSVKDKQQNEFMWQADASVWPRHAPILFPIVGKLKDGIYKYNGLPYSLSQHGFARDKQFFVKAEGDDFVVFYLNSDPSTQAVFPFDFELIVSYALIKNKLIVDYKVMNIGVNVMPFSIGAHPGFRCPIASNDSLEDYSIVFENKETLKRLHLKDGLLSGDSSDFLIHASEIKLTPSLFLSDAIIVQNFTSNFISLVSNKTKHSVKVSIHGFPYLGIWSKPGAEFVCIEPWFGISDTTNASGKLEDKNGIQLLAPNQAFTCSFSMEFK
jgi:galactose mutarotase-like enzyme